MWYAVATSLNTINHALIYCFTSFSFSGTPLLKLPHHWFHLFSLIIESTSSSYDLHLLFFFFLGVLINCENIGDDDSCFLMMNKLWWRVRSKSIRYKIVTTNRGICLRGTSISPSSLFAFFVKISASIVFVCPIFELLYNFTENESLFWMRRSEDINFIWIFVDLIINLLLIMNAQLDLDASCSVLQFFFFDKNSQLPSIPISILSI